LLSAQDTNLENTGVKLFTNKRGFTKWIANLTQVETSFETSDIPTQAAMDALKASRGKVQEAAAAATKFTKGIFPLKLLWMHLKHHGARFKRLLLLLNPPRGYFQSSCYGCT
jgi:hypothetical protein